MEEVGVRLGEERFDEVEGDGGAVAAGREERLVLRGGEEEVAEAGAAVEVVRGARDFDALGDGEGVAPDEAVVKGDFGRRRGRQGR